MAEKSNLAPVVVFCYNRPSHFRKTLEALQANTLAAESRLFVFSDGYRGEADREQVLEVREYAGKIEGFEEVTVVKAGKNKGLSGSVIDGVTRVITEYGRVIVLEDDMVTTPDFLAYMNGLLEAYRSRADVFSVTAYAPPVKIPRGYTKDFYLAPRSSSWGWGTWKDRWALADWGSGSYEKVVKDAALKRRFTSGGSDLWPMIVKQQRGVIDSWAVRWCLSQSLHNGYGVYPVQSKLSNIGTDGSGANFTFSTKVYDVDLNYGSPVIDPGLMPEKEVIRAFKRFYDLPFYLKLKNLVRYGV